MKKFRTFEHIINEYKKTNKLDEKLLPLVHTTSFDTFDRYIANSNNILKANKSCEYHNNEMLIFLFYGKAAYIPPKDQEERYDKNLPVTLIYNKIEEIGKIKRISCFDSGAYINGRFNLNGNNTPEPINTLNDYLKENPEVSDLIAGVKALYKNNKNYLKNIIDPFYDIEKKPYCTCLRTLWRLYKKESTNYGQQAFTFEVQVSKKVNKEPDVLILPEKKASDTEMIFGWIEQFSNNIEIRTYKHENESIPIAYYKMRKVVLEYNLELL